MDCSNWAAIYSALQSFSQGQQPTQLTTEAIICVQKVLWVTSPQAVTTDSILWVMLLVVHLAVLVAFMISFFALYTSF